MGCTGIFISWRLVFADEAYDRPAARVYDIGQELGEDLHARRKRAQFLNVPMEGAAEYSEATAELIDSEVKDIVNQQYARALEILQQ